MTAVATQFAERQKKCYHPGAMNTMTPNYDMGGLDERAAAALEAHRGYVEGLEEKYQSRTRVRRELGVPALALVGMGRAGKDTAGEYLSKRFDLAKPVSSSMNAMPLAAHMAGVRDEKDFPAFYAERHQNRVFWIHALHALRRGDLTRLARWCLGACDLAIGLRGKEEFAAVMKNGVCDLSVWVNRDVPDDPTTEFAREDCDVVIDNTTTLERFHSRLERFGITVYRRV